MNSCLYECAVMHHRLSPREHHFRYRMFLFALDLDELDQIARELPLFGRNRPSLYTFRDRDHLTLPGLADSSTRENVIAFLAEHGIQIPDAGRITLVTLPRVLGYIFNPVSFYFCHDAEGRPLCAISEVGNTFGEMKPYLLRSPESNGRFRLVTPKHFYVSPFSALDLAFDFRLTTPGERLEVHIDDLKDGRKVLVSALSGRRVPLSASNLLWFTFKYPLITLQVIFLIHWEALRLWLKRLPWIRKDANVGLQRDVLRPHATLSAKSL